MTNINQTPQQQKGNSKNAFIIISVLLGLLIVVNVAGFFTGTVVTGNTMETKVSEKDLTLAELQKQYDSNKRQLDSLAIVFPQMQQEIEMQKVKLEEQRLQILADIQTGKDLKVAQQRIEALTIQKDQFAAKIAQLEGKVAQVTETYRKEKQEWEEVYNTTTQQIAEEKARNETLEEENRKQRENEAKERARKIEEQNRLEDKAFLAASKVSIKAVEMNKKGKERDATRAKTAERFRISFEHGVDNYVKQGETNFLIRVIDPQGLTIGEVGTDLDKAIKTPFKYTAKAQTNYDGQANKIEVNWDLAEGQKLNKGTYTIEIYHNGWKAGQGSVVLK